MTGTRQQQNARVRREDETVEMLVDEIDPGARAPVAEKAGLDVLGAERLLEKRVRPEIDLRGRQVVGGAPVPGDGFHGSLLTCLGGASFHIDQVSAPD